MFTALEYVRAKNARDLFCHDYIKEHVLNSDPNLTLP